LAAEQQAADAAAGIQAAQQKVDEAKQAAAYLLNAVQKAKDDQVRLDAIAQTAADRVAQQIGAQARGQNVPQSRTITPTVQRTVLQPRASSTVTGEFGGNLVL
jgi:hypothetical protein